MAAERTTPAVTDARPAGGNRHWPVIVLILLAGTMIVAALAGLWLVSHKERDYASPGQHIEVWQSYNLRLQLESLIDIARAVDDSHARAAELKLRLGVMRTALSPLLHTHAFDFLDPPRRAAVRATLERLAQHSDGWLQALERRDRASARRIAGEVLSSLPQERQAVHDVIAAANVAVATQLDHERRSLQRTFHWLTATLIILAVGCLLLALEIFITQRRTRRLAIELQQLNASLERRVLERTRLLHERETLLRTILESTPSDVTLLSADQRRVFYVSDNLLMQSGIDRAESFRLEALFVDADDYAHFLERLERNEAIHQMETQLCPHAPYWALLTARPLQVHAQSAWLIWCLDITRHHRMQERLEQLAATDALTGLNNRRALLRATVYHLRRRRSAPLSVLLIDIDHFKRINDQHGHPVGDEALRSIARRLQALLREETLIGRVGGEEFAVVLPDTPIEDAVTVAERLRGAIAETPLEIDATLSLSVTLSIGLTRWLEGDTLKRMMRRADRGLYRAKAEGRNRVVLADEE